MGHIKLVYLLYTSGSSNLAQQDWLPAWVFLPRNWNPSFTTSAMSCISQGSKEEEGVAKMDLLTEEEYLEILDTFHPRTKCWMMTIQQVYRQDGSRCRKDLLMRSIWMSFLMTCATRQPMKLPAT
jgi:hypothetical protein